jgi:hypothetical protein
MIIDELVSDTPEWISQEFCRTKIVKINFEDA